MRYINPNSNRGLVNKFADFILNKLTLEYDSVIEVTDCGKFFIINGMTNREDILDMSKVQEEFQSQNKELLLKFGYESINIIDLILYNVELEKKTDYWFTFHYTKRPTFSNKLTEFIQSTDLNISSIHETDKLYLELEYSEDNVSNLDNFYYSPMTVTSEFPYGHSLNMGRLHFYYSEYISNHILPVVKASKIDFKISTKINDDEDFDIEVYCPSSPYSEKTIKSLILDVFNFNLEEFKYILSNYNILDDLDKMFDDKPWLVKDRFNDLIII